MRSAIGAHVGAGKVRTTLLVSITPLESHKTAVALLELTTMLRGGPPTMVNDAPPE